MDKLRANPPKEMAGFEIVRTSDYLTSVAVTAEGQTSIELPKSNVLEYELSNGCTAIVRPSGTEPKIKLYLSIVGQNLDEIHERTTQIGENVKKILGV